MKRLAIVTTHPIQYYAPVFELISQRQKIGIKVFYTWGEKALNKYDPGFGRTVNWDIPLLNGYDHTFIQNTSGEPGSHHYNGIINPTLIQQVNKYKPDAVLIYGWAYQSHLKTIRYFKNKIPVFFRGDSTLLDEKQGLKNFLKSIFLRWVYKHIDCAFYVGSNNKAYYKKYGLKDDQLVFAPHAIDNQRFAEEKTIESKQFRQKLNLSDGDILILFAGKLEEKKSPLLLLEAFLDIKKPGVHLLFLGNGVLEELLKVKAGNEGTVHFVDFQNQSVMPVVYQSCDLFCLPSEGPGETWGLAVNEAMACGKVILASDKVGCAIDLVQQGYNGAIFKHGDRNALAASLDTLTQSKVELRQYGENSKKLVENWNFVKIAESIENKLNETVRSN
jgi:glycosyltransferase involved in cell wall biosynthesis